MSINLGDNPFYSQTEIFPEDPEQLRIRLSQIYQDLSQKGNQREIATYTFNETATAQIFPGSNPLNPRNGFRKAINITALALGANSFAHGITFPTPNTIRFVNLYGVIYDLTVPQYEAVPNDDIHLAVVGANAVITIPAAYVGFTGIVILEYTKTN